MVTLKAEERAPDIKAKKLRKTGMIPGCIFGKGLEETLPIQISESEVRKYLQTNSTGSTAQISIKGEKYAALLKEISRNPVAKQIEHLSFQELVKGELVTSSAHIILNNREKIEGLVNQSLFEIAYKTVPSKLIDKIEIDLEGMKAGNSLRVDELEMAKDEKIELITAPDTLVFSIVDRRRAADSDVENEITEGENTAE